MNRAHLHFEGTLTAVEPGPWDLVFFRNMAVDLEQAPAARLRGELVEHLAPHGLIVAGKADIPPRSLPLRKLGPSLYRKADAA